MAVGGGGEDVSGYSPSTTVARSRLNQVASRYYLSDFIKICCMLHRHMYIQLAELPENVTQSDKQTVFGQCKAPHNMSLLMHHMGQQSASIGGSLSHAYYNIEDNIKEKQYYTYIYGIY